MCSSLFAPSEDREVLMDAPFGPNPLSETLNASQSVPSFPNLNRSYSPPPVETAGGGMYAGIFDAEAQQEDPGNSSPFRRLKGNSLSPWPSVLPSNESRSWHSSRVSAVAPDVWDSERASDDNWLFSDDNGAHSNNEISASTVVPSGVGAGLSNLGNTCFLNAILQCLTHTVPLVLGLRSCNHSTPCAGHIDGLCVVCALREHIQSSLVASGGYLSPLKFVDNLNHFSSVFRRYQQEDAHEFLQCALDKLERCFLDLKKSNISFEDDNLVEKVFGGRLISKLRCCNCGCCSDTYEPLIDLSLEIDNVDTLPNALESFTKMENIDAKFRCDSCKEEVSMEKRLILDQTPLVASFHLKRFKTDGTYVEKIDKHVDFPLELDLMSYTTFNQNNSVPLKYELYAVVVHVGISSTSGHYFCFVRSAPDIWHKLDDAMVTKVSVDFVLSQEAYILFYARQGTPWFSSIMESQTPCVGSSILNTSPKSVLDIDDSMYKSNPILIPNSVRGETRESKEFSNQGFDYSCQERHELPEFNDSSGASHGFVQFPSGSNQESVDFDGSKDIHAQVLLGNNAILNGSTVFDGNSYIESVDLNKNDCCQEVVDFRENDGFHALTPPGPPSPDASDRSFLISRDHLKMENHGSCKKPSNKFTADSERQAAVRYVRKMPGRKRDAFLSLVDASSDKKRKRMDASLFNKGNPLIAPKNRRVTAGIPQ
ncbi:ubiquitin carboxyl-terminal hydrolase 16-like [Gastrolobium bilobum]|uniref:ubiquitin carboxyl-terminal hydrolase 16-like n=1 Tax=Gastrolobium bilobum TaxID=150636 RepID=UPI002AB17277|nr:ubiquitin carboxyl-terminal hydrolase 16-like [Gastrolobium bilobum]